MVAASRRSFLYALAAAAPGLATTTHAVTPLPDADGQYWDIQDTSTWSQDSGGVATGGKASPFNGFGYLKIRVSQADGRVLATNQYLRGFGLARDGERFDSLTPVLTAGIVVSRALLAPRDTVWLRYLDTFMNASAERRTVSVAWGGASGAYAEGGLVAVATTGSGDRRIDARDSFVTLMQNSASVADPMQGPSGHGPSAHVLGTRTASLAVRAGDMYGDPFVDPYPGYDPAQIGYVYTFTLAPGETAALMSFVVKGLSEVYDPRGGPPTNLKGAIVAPYFDPVYTGADAKIPAAGSEIARVTAIAKALVARPDLRGLTPRELASIVNWSVPSTAAAVPFSVVGRSVPELQAALARGDVTSQDLLREYLTRLTLYDRSGPGYKAMLALNREAFATARALDAERAAGRVRSPFHGIPIVFKDNIDVVGLPTTGGSLALADHRPRLDSKVAAGMRRAGAIVLGKANLDEFPFGDFGVSTVGGTIGNAFDPSLSTSGSSGGSAVAVAADLAALAFGTDTCNSLSNPASFASLATIRTTRGLTSRAGVQPLRPYNDAVGPIARSVRDVALALDQVAGSDPEDPVTAAANAHVEGSFAAGLDSATLRGQRIGLLRQRYVGFTGEREVAALMTRVEHELRAGGATLVEVAIPNLDDLFVAGRGREPGAVKAAWNAYLARGAGAGERTLTIEALLASGKLAPESAARFKDALAPLPEGAALDAAKRHFYETREAFRRTLVDLMERERLDAILYPANQARPHTHEGGLERYGSEPGTCQESAMTGLPQVTVPAGFISGRYPVGISFLGRPWDDGRLLGIGHAYEQATRHRRAPALTLHPEP